MSKNKAEREFTVLEERARCLRLIYDYRDKIAYSMNKLQQYTAHLPLAVVDRMVKVNGISMRESDATMLADAICKSLDRICEEIRRPKAKADGDFSLEEIQQAFNIVDELSNPFEE